MSDSKTTKEPIQVAGERLGYQIGTTVWVTRLVWFDSPYFLPTAGEGKDDMRTNRKSNARLNHKYTRTVASTNQLSATKFSHQSEYNACIIM